MKNKLVNINSERTVQAKALPVFCPRKTRCLTYQAVVKLLAGLAILQFSCWSYAFEQHEAHEHGVAQLNIVKEGSSFIIALETPAANILGFEHQPETEQQKQAVAMAQELLNAPGKLFRLPQDASCRLMDTDLEAEVLAGGEQTGHADLHQDDHAQHHDDHRNDKHQHEMEHEEHGHDKHADKHSHSDIDVQYTFNCDDPAKLTNVEVLLFKTFSGFEEINTQIISDKGQQAVELTPAKTNINL